MSVLFADLVGFTTLAESRDPEDVREVLDRYFDLASTVLQQHGGTVEKFIGDAVMAVWGAPTAHEDDAERAVRAGLELVDAVERLGPGIRARAAVMTGDAAVTIGAGNQGLVAGDLVNTASRLQGVAPPGVVLVGETTQRTAERAIAFEPAGEHALRGKDAAVRAWRAVRVVAERGGRNRAAGLEAPFVGREEELRLLKDLFHATERERRARLVSVMGPAGIGKTRLAWEFLKYVDGLVEPVWWHEGRSPAYGDGITFWALGEMVRERCGLREGDDEAATRSGVAAALGEHIPDESERAWVEAAILELLGLGAGVAAERLFGAWRVFFERLATSAPVVMVFEDLQHADSGLLDFIDHLLDWSREIPLFVLTLARPELLDRRPEWGVAKRAFVSTHLEPLSEPATTQLLAGLAPGVPEPLARAIVSRAEGIPLYVVETVRMLIAEGRLIPSEGGRFAPSGDIATLAVPETLTELIAARLDSLPVDERALVSDASVLGQSFALETLAAVSGRTADALERHLRGLVRHEILAVEANPRSPELGRYAFVQALIREVAYNTLARRDRRVRHLAAARSLASLGSPELAGAVAGHYLAAYRNATPGEEADRLAPLALVTLEAAAERAVALGSYLQAVTFLREALSIVTDPAAEAGLLERCGVAAATAGRYDEAEDLLRRALGLRRAHGDREAIARATTLLARASIDAFRTERSLALLEGAVGEFADLSGGAVYCALEAQLARAYFMAEQPERSIEVSSRVLEVSRSLGLVPIEADTLITLGSALVEGVYYGIRVGGRLTEGAGRVRDGIALADAHGLVLASLRGRMNLGNFTSGDDPRAALASAKEGLAEARRLGLLHWAALFLANAAEYGVVIGEWDWVDRELGLALDADLDPLDRANLLAMRIVLEAYRGHDVEGWLAELRALVDGAADLQVAVVVPEAEGELALAAGRLREAREAHHAIAQTVPFVAASAYQVAARAAIWDRDLDGARDDLQGLDEAADWGRLAGHQHTAIRAGIAALEGRTDDALTLYRESVAGLGELDLPWQQALVAIDMATVLDRADPYVAATAEHARATMVELGAHPFVERLDAALGRPRI